MKRYDAHCHFFNMWYPIREAAAIAWDMIVGDYPRDPKTFEEKRSTRKIPKLGDVLDFIKQISQVYSVFTGDYEKNYNLLEKKFNISYDKSVDFCAIPLMMDIYFTFDSEYRDSKIQNEPIPENIKGEFSSWFSKAKNIVIEETVRNGKETRSRKKIESEIEEAFAEISDEILNDYSVTKRDLRLLMTPGFNKEIKQCISLQKKKNGNVFPFLAVDPRRVGIFELIQNGSGYGINGPLVSKNGPFYGIKLYPHLGYLPSDCMDVLIWCGKNKIPVTSHTNVGGYPPWNNMYNENGNPDNWLTVFKDDRIQDLTVDLAHFGNGNKEWQNAIINGMRNETKGNRLFTDIACFTDMSDMKNARTLYETNKDVLGGRLLFGTDYDIMLITGLGLSLDNYLNNFRTVFHDNGSQEMEDDLTITAPKSFLNLL